MGTDHDFDRSLGNALLDTRQLLAGDQTRSLPDVYRKPAKSLAEGFEVLAREQRRRHHDGDLPSLHRGDEGGAQRNLGLAEPDVAADQAIHRPAGRQLTDNDIDRNLLVIGFLIRKTRAEFIVRSGFGRQSGSFASETLGGDLDQLVGDLADTALHPSLARLPSSAAEPIELDGGIFRPVA